MRPYISPASGKVRSNNFVLGLSGAGQFGLVAQYPTEAILDVTGYFLNQTMTLTLRDDADRLTTEYTVSPSGATRLRDYFYLGDLLVATREQSGGTWRYYHSDHLGSPRLVTSATGGVLETHKYLPFGAEIGGSFGIQPMKFAGLERDASSGKDYALARQFGSSEGRFFRPEILQGDSGEAQSWNRYSYVWNNPVNLIDPDGLWPGIGIGRSYLMWQNAFHFDSNTRTLTGSIFVNQTLLRLSYGFNGFIGSMGDSVPPTPFRTSLSYLDEFEFPAWKPPILSECRDPLAARWWQNVQTTNREIPQLVRLVGSLATGSLIARSQGLPTGLTWTLNGFRAMSIQGVPQSGLATLATVGFVPVINAVLAGGAFELGVGVGSLINATLIQPCAE